VRDAAAHGTHGFGEPVEHCLRPEFVVQRVAMNAKFARGLRDIALARRHRRDDVLSFERFDCLRECDSVADQLTNDRIQAVVDTYHVLNLEALWFVGAKARFYYSRFDGHEEKIFFIDAA
jgi:hypothetical protein